VNRAAYARQAAREAMLTARLEYFEKRLPAALARLEEARALARYRDAFNDCYRATYGIEAPALLRRQI